MQMTCITTKYTFHLFDAIVFYKVFIVKTGTVVLLKI